MFLTGLFLSYFSGEYSLIVSFIKTHSRVVPDILEQQVFLVLGCFTMFYFVHQYGSIQIALITTLRKTMTILISLLLFSHPMNRHHILGLSLIFLVIAVEVQKAYIKIK